MLINLSKTQLVWNHAENKIGKIHLQKTASVEHHHMDSNWPQVLTKKAQ